MPLQHIGLATALAILAPVAGAAPAAAQNNQVETARPSAQNKESSSAEKKICRKLDTTGTRMVRPTCLTKEQWRKVESLAN